jgi:hypothetical protein
MTRKSSPITPPPELVQQWTEATRYKKDMPYPEGYEQCEQRLATAAAQWGADQELEACCEVVNRWVGPWHPGIKLPDRLRAARRPKPPSLKEQALEQLGSIQTDLNKFGMGISTDTIRRALEALPND